MYIQLKELLESEAYLDILDFWKKLSIHVRIKAKQILEKKMKYDIQLK